MSACNLVALTLYRATVTPPSVAANQTFQILIWFTGKWWKIGKQWILRVISRLAKTSTQSVGHLTITSNLYLFIFVRSRLSEHQFCKTTTATQSNSSEVKASATSSDTGDQRESRTATTFLKSEKKKQAYWRINWKIVIFTSQGKPLPRLVALAICYKSNHDTKC